MRPAGGELLGDDLADALATPGDEGEFAFEVSHRPRYARLGTAPPTWLWTKSATLPSVL